MLLLIPIYLALALVGSLLVLNRHKIFVLRKHGIVAYSAKMLFQLAANSPAPVKLSLGVTRVVIITKPAHLQIVLNSPHCLDKSKMHSFFRVDRGLFGAPGHIWKHDRKVFGPSFGLAIMPRFVDIFNEKMALFVQLASKHVGKERNFQIDIARCFMDITFTTAFGMNLNTQLTEEGYKFALLLDEYVHLVSNRIFTPWLHFEFVYRMTNAYKRECEILNFAYEIIGRLFKERTQEIRSPSDDEGPKNFADKLCEILQKSDFVNDPFMRDHELTILLAGSDTSMTAICNTLLVLAVHQDIQDRVYQEIVDVLGDDQSRPISQQDATHFTYMEMVCKETLRLLPVAGIMGRQASQSISLDEHTTISPNSQLIIPLYTLLRDPTVWGPTVNEFDPERFRPEAVAQRHPYAFLPFGGGTRMCIGTRYAWLSMKIMLGHVLRRYRLRTSLAFADISFDYNTPILLRTEQGCQIWLEQR